MTPREWLAAVSPLAKGIILYTLLINVITFFYFGVDKFKSTTEGARRVRERTLWLLSLVGGSAGGLLAMKIFRHKTKKTAFQLVMALVVLIQIAIIVFLVRP